MAVIELSTTINTTPEHVCQVIEAPSRMKEWVPNVTRVADIQQTPQRMGDSFRATYSVMGLGFPSKYTVVDFARNKKITLKMEGALTGTFAWDVAPRGSSVKVKVHIDYVMKGGILGKAMNAMLVERMNAKNAERMLENLKMLCEAEAKR
jgi:carbon monoxide dehydrogenase subunit G